MFSLKVYSPSAPPYVGFSPASGGCRKGFIGLTEVAWSCNIYSIELRESANLKTYFYGMIRLKRESSRIFFIMGDKYGKDRITDSKEFQEI